MVSVAPEMLLIRDPIFYGPAIGIERALGRVCNTITVTSYNGWWLPYIYRLPNFLPIVLSKAICLPVKKIPIDLSKVHETINLILVCDPVRERFDFSRFNALTAYYAIDSQVPYVFDGHINDAHIDEYDYVFVAQKDYIRKYEEHGCKEVYWLPFAWDPAICSPYELHRRYDVCFVGSRRFYLPKKALRSREEFISKLQKEFNMFTGGWGRGWRFVHDLGKVYSQSKIMFNRSGSGEITLRVFDGMSCGCLVMTDRIGNGLEELFVDGKHLVIYDGFDDLVEKIRYYLDDEEEREEIAMRGQQEVYRHHTYLHRVRYMLSKIFGKC